MLKLDELFKLFEELEPNVKVLEEAQSQVIPIELFSVELTEKLGDSEASPARSELEKMIANATGITGPGKLEQKLKALQQATENVKKENDVSKLMAQVTILTSIYKMLSSFQPSPAGFLNEAFMSVFYGTEQKKINPEAEEEEESTGTEIADVYTHSIEGGLPVSIKTIRPDGGVGGSKKLLEQAVTKHGKVLFHIYEKAGDQKAPQQLKFYEFVIDRKNLHLVTSRSYDEIEEARRGRKKDPINFLLDLKKTAENKKAFVKTAIKNKTFPQDYDWKDPQKKEQFLSEIQKIFKTAFNLRQEIVNAIDQHLETQKKETGKKPRFEIGADIWKSWSGAPKAVLTIDPATTNSIIENKIKILNKSIVDLAIHIKELSSNLKNYCFSKDPEKVSFGDKAMEASKQVFPETKEAVSSFKEE